MDDGEGGGLSRLGKKSLDKSGEVDYKTKAGTAWSHSFLNQKPWHPLSYPNQRRKWIAEQTDAQKQRRAEEVAREYAQEQEFLRQTALLSKKEQEKLEMMKAVSFLYVKPPGYNAESAKAAEVAEEKKKQADEKDVLEQSLDVTSSSMKVENKPPEEVKKKPRPKDVFGRALPTEEQFEVLKNAPKLETGVAGRAKPFGVEIRNVKCLRCGTYGHQSGDRECPLKDAIMPNEESRLKRDDPLTAIQAQTDPSEPLKWELKQKPGMSPPRGGFDPDDPNQQIVAEDIFDEYGGFLGEINIPELITDFSKSKNKKKKKSNKSSNNRRRSPSVGSEMRDGERSGSPSGDDRRRRKEKKRDMRNSDNRRRSPSVSSETRDDERSESSSGDDRRRRRRKEEKRIKRNNDNRRRSPSVGSETRDDKRSRPSSGDDRRRRKEKRDNSDKRKKRRRHSESSSPESSDRNRHQKRENKHDNHHHTSSSEASDSDEHESRHRHQHRHRRSHQDRHHHTHRVRHRHHNPIS